MRAADLGRKRVGVWGLGREGRAAIALLRRHHPGLPIVLLDDKDDEEAAASLGPCVTCAFGAAAIGRALDSLEVVVKSPGVSLYRPEIARAREKSVSFTSLLNLWFAEPRAAKTICVTGTKGKSTTAALLAHLLRALGHKVALAGNIGVALGEPDTAAAEFVVIEVSSYQAADFDGLCDIAVLTSLFPEHLDWHGSLDNYYRDKLRLLAHARRSVIEREAAARAASPPAAAVLFNDEGGLHARGNLVFAGARFVGEIANRYLARPHNRSNLCAALSVVELCAGDLPRALAAAADFIGLPHRQQELGEVGGALVVDDSISTTPESTIAALGVYQGRDITLILGGYDRGIDYEKLVECLCGGAARSVICLGASGSRIRGALAHARFPGALHRAVSMREAVDLARQLTPKGGVVLLSPAAPSYGQYRDFIERGRDFAARIGLPVR
ncbi:MAG TPA: UDP-N-acetylmuramoyl-L-alanine--D-glutamate ligase [Stellaceae bacterium]|nr:UDP-N-acetylmuramoyl-L-alanine--D-glutamate ligase [Stellaceae bacterium]